MNIFIGNKRKIKAHQQLYKSIVRMYQLEIFWLHITDNPTQMALKQKKSGKQGRILCSHNQKVSKYDAFR